MIYTPYMISIIGRLERDRTHVCRPPKLGVVLADCDPDELIHAVETPLVRSLTVRLRARKGDGCERAGGRREHGGSGN